MKEHSPSQKKLPGETLLSTARPSLKHHTRVINRPSAYLMKPDGTLGGKLNKRTQYSHHLHTNVWRSMIVVVWAKHVVFNNTSAHDHGQPSLHCTSTAYCGYHTKSLNTDGMHSSKLTVINVEFSVPRFVTSTLRDQRSFTVTTETSLRNLAPAHPSNTTHIVINRPSGSF